MITNILLGLILLGLIFIGFMVFANLIALVMLSGEVKKISDS